MRVLVTILILLAIGAGGAWWLSGRGEPPAIEFTHPGKLIGQRGDLVVVVKTPAGKLTEFKVNLEQGGKTIPLFDLAKDAALLKREGDQVTFTRKIGKRDLPELA